MMIQRIFDLSVCAFEFYVNYHLLNHFLNRRNSTRRATVIGLIAAMTVVLYLINSTFRMFLINSGAAIVLFFVMALVLFDATPAKCLLLSLAGSCISVLSEFLTAFAASSVLADGFAQLMQSPFYISVFTIVSKMIQFTSVRLVALLVGNKRYRAETRETLYLLICPLLAIANMYFLIYLDVGRVTHKIEHFFIFSFGIGWIFVSIILLRVYNTALERHELAHRLKVVEIEKSAEQEYIHRQRINEMTLRKIMHDLKNQLINVRHISQGNPEGGLLCLNTVIESLKESPKMEITTDYHNLALNQILNRNRSTCAHLGIDLKIQIEYDDLGFIGFLDTSTILDNAFDNAVTACDNIRDKQEKYIHLRIFRQGQMIVLVMRNSRQNELLIGETKVISTKQDKENHGLGLESIRTAVSHYDGTVYIETPDNEFILTITININK